MEAFIADLYLRGLLEGFCNLHAIKGCVIHAQLFAEIKVRFQSICASQLERVLRRQKQLTWTMTWVLTSSGLIPGVSLRCCTIRVKAQMTESSTYPYNNDILLRATKQLG